MPVWWYRVWGTVTTVPLWKTLGKVGIRPVGVSNPLRRTLHSQVIKQNHGALTTYLEPQQLALSTAGGHKLVHSVRMAAEFHRSWVVVKLDLKNAHNEMSRAATLEELEAEPTLRHLAWHAAMVLAPNNSLETRGEVWGEQEEGNIQGDPEASGFFCVGLHRNVRTLDGEVAQAGGFARLGNDDGYVCGPPEVVFPAVARFEVDIRLRCGLQLQRDKTEVFSWGTLPQQAPADMKRAGVQVENIVEPGFLCYDIPVGSQAYC